MKKLLLINPPQEHSITANLPRYVDDVRGNIPPLGLLYTASAVKRNSPNWSVQICDMAAGQELGDWHPDLVGITTTTFTLLDALSVAKTVKERYRATVVLGGIHPTIYPKETSKLPNIDCVFAGESEATFPIAIDLIASGLATVVQGSIPNINNIPEVDYALLDSSLYFSVIGGTRYLTSMVTSRGCPYHCIFCHRATMGKRYRARSADQVVSEICNLARSGVNEILIYDDTFTLDWQRAYDICLGIIEAKDKNIIPDVKFDIRTRVDTVDKELLYALRDAGCHRIHYGIEASNNRILKILAKGITIEQAWRVLGDTRELGIETLVYFILGSPTESRKEILDTIELSKALKPNYAHFAIMTPYPATPLYTLGLKQGRYSDYWAEFALRPTEDFRAPFWPDLEREELLELLDRAYKEFYLRPRVVLREAVKTKSIRQLIQKGRSAISMIEGAK